jgi:hypothetical protein
VTKTREKTGKDLDQVLEGRGQGEEVLDHVFDKKGAGLGPKAYSSVQPPVMGC